MGNYIIWGVYNSAEADLKKTKELMLHSVGLAIAPRNFGKIRQVKTIKVSQQIWNVLGATHWLVIREGRNVSWFSCLELAKTL